MTYQDALALWKSSSDDERRVLIAERVLKWRKVKGSDWDYDGHCESHDVFVPDDAEPNNYPPRGVIPPWYWCKNWLTDANDAFSLVDFMEKTLGTYGCPEIDEDRLREKGRFFLYGPNSAHGWGKWAGWRAGWYDRDQDYQLVWAEGETKERAICLASFIASVIVSDG